jgi:hypothetical protein
MRRGTRAAKYLEALSVEGLLKPCSSSGQFTVREFFPKKGNKPSGLVEQPWEFLEPTARIF